jgi:hypothetical protein
VLKVGGDLDLFEKSLGADHDSQLGLEHLDGDLAVVFDILREINRGHAAGTELALDSVAVGEGGGEASGGIGHAIGE